VARAVAEAVALGVPIVSLAVSPSSRLFVPLSSPLAMSAGLHLNRRTVVSE
jgi:hypothetical protein